MDDFDTAFSLTADIDSRVEQAAIAFSPKLGSLDLSAAELVRFQSLKHLLVGARPNRQTDNQGKPYYNATTHSFQQRLPLMMVAKFSVSGLGKMVSALEMETALYQAGVRRINRVFDQAAKDSVSLKTAPNLVSPIDLDSVRISLLDTQGSAEFTMAIFCTNYSVGGLAVSALRSLTLRDLFRESPDLARKFRESKVRSSLQELLKRNNESAQFDDFFDNHVFSRSYTTAGVVAECLREDASLSQISGFVSVTPNFQVAPGHTGEAERSVWQALSATNKNRPFRVRDIGERSRFHVLSLGRYDMVLHPSLSTKHVIGEFPAHTTQEFLRHLATFYQHLGVVAPDWMSLVGPTNWEPNDVHETIVAETSCSIEIPVPMVKLIHPDGSSGAMLPRRRRKSHTPFLPALARLQFEIFHHTVPNRMAVFDIDGLEFHMKRLGIPRGLRRSIRYVFQNFRFALADPVLFYKVLDLYDSLATLYRALCTPSCNESNSALIPEETLADIAHFMRALQQAMSYRVSSRSPFVEERDFAIEFRGLLSQIVAAVDAPLKCGVGMTKDCIEHRYGVRPPKDTVGRISNLTLGRQVEIRQVRFEENLSELPGNSVTLASVDVGVDVLCAPEQLVCLLHESFHSAVAMQNFLPDDRDHSRDDCSFHALRDRLEELFVLRLEFLFVFNGDSRLNALHHLVAYGTHPISRPLSDRVSVQRFLEWTLRVYVSTAQPSNLAVSSLVEGYLQFVKDYRQILPLDDFLGDFSREFDTLCVGYAERFTRSVMPCLAKTLKSADAVYETWWEYVREKSSAKGSMDREAIIALIEATVDDCMSNGIPDVEAAVPYEAKQWDKISSFYYICVVFRRYFHFLFEGVDGSVQLFVRPNNGTVRRPAHPSFRFEHGSAVSLCSDFEQRRNRVQRHVQLYKYLWGVACRLNGERFVDLVDAVSSAGRNDSLT
ncbi:MAG: hypothetical protein R3C18_14095 [Planctomycetaceae bacterium]